MKRPPGIWILLSAGVLWLSIQDAHGIRATALIFGKSTTTAPPEPVGNATDRNGDTEVVTESSAENGVSVSNTNSTKTNLTGNPQLDYIYDPNLPKELNGYNLSDYPFYERVPDPEEIDFKCDGLHDGFYASIPFKCQVYHHCLFGTRYDFLCANYTAFDQKTFICQFVSDVDCLGSKKFWHRNDALYQAATTTTSKPLNIYTTAPPPEANKPAGGPRGGGGKRRRPIQRRPQYDFYDYADDEEDYYEDRPRSRRRRPRPRPRPLYDDEYDDDYEEEIYERRNRRPYNRRGSGGGSDRKRNKNRNKNDEALEEDEETIRPKDTRKKYDYEEDDYKTTDRKKPIIRDEEDNVEERKVERRKPSRDESHDDDILVDKRKKNNNNNRDEDEDEKPIGKRKQNNRPLSGEDKPNEKRKTILRDDNLEEDYDARPSRPRKTSRRPPLEDDYEELPSTRNGGDRRDNRPRKKNSDTPEVNDDKPIIKPTTGTIYDRPRVAPRIKPPVPKNEANKYAYKPITKVTSAPLEDDEYYDDYEELPSKKSKTRKPEAAVDPIKPSESKERNKQAPSLTRTKTRTTLDEEDDALTLSNQKPSSSRTKPENSRGKDRFRSSRPQSKTTEEPLLNEQEEEEVIVPQRNKPSYTSHDRPQYEQEEVFKEKIPSNISNEKDEGTQRRRPFNNNNQNERTTTKKKPIETEYYDDEYEIEKTNEDSKPITSSTTTTTSTIAPRKKWKPNAISTDPPYSSTTTTTQRVTTKLTTTTTSAPTSSESYKERTDQVVRIVKRPFLPSRGGNPYSSRGLQPVGFKAQKSEVMEPQGSVDVQQKSKDEPVHFEEPQSQHTSRQHITPQNNANQRQKYIESTYDEARPVKSYTKPKFSEPISEDDNDFKPMKPPIHILRPNFDGNNEYNGPRTTQKPKVPERNPAPERFPVVPERFPAVPARNPIPERNNNPVQESRNPLDINENEYDVTLNDALNPTLPNLPVRGNFPNSGGYNPATDYTFNSFQRQRYVLEPVISPVEADFVYQQPKQQPVRQRYDSVPQSYNSRDQFVAPSNNEYKNYFGAPLASNGLKRGLTQAQTQPFYSTSY